MAIIPYLLTKGDYTNHMKKGLNMIRKNKKRLVTLKWIRERQTSALKYKKVLDT